MSEPEQGARLDFKKLADEFKMARNQVITIPQEDRRLQVDEKGYLVAPKYPVVLVREVWDKTTKSYHWFYKRVSLPVAPFRELMIALDRDNYASVASIIWVPDGEVICRLLVSRSEMVFPGWSRHPSRDTDLPLEYPHE